MGTQSTASHDIKGHWQRNWTVNCSASQRMARQDSDADEASRQELLFLSDAKRQGSLSSLQFRPHRHPHMGETHDRDPEFCQVSHTIHSTFSLNAIYTASKLRSILQIISFPSLSFVIEGASHQMTQAELPHDDTPTNGGGGAQSTTSSI